MAKHEPIDIQNDALCVTATVIGTTCLLYVGLLWLLRVGLGALLHAVCGTAVPGWALWLCNFLAATVCLLAAYQLLLRTTPRALRVKLPFAVIHDLRLMLFIPAFLGVVLGVNMGTQALRSFLVKHTAYTAPAATQLPRGVFPMLLCFLTLCVVPAFLEEFLVRGLMQTMLARWGVWFGIVVSGVAFSLMHSDIAVMPGVFVISVLLGLCVYCTHSLWASIFLHFLNNLMAFILLLLQQRMHDNNATMFGAWFIAVLLFVAVTGVVFIIRTGLLRTLEPVPPVAQQKNRQQRLRRLAGTPVYLAAMVVLALRALLPLWVK